MKDNGEITMVLLVNIRTKEHEHYYYYYLLYLTYLLNSLLLLVGLPLQILLNQTRDFLNKHDGEVIILELASPEYGTDDLTKQFINQIETTVGQFLYPRSKEFPTINQMIQSGKRLLMTFDDKSVLSRYPSLWFPDTIINSYADSPILDDMERYNIGKVNQFKTNGTFPAQLFKISWTLTADRKHHSLN